MCIKSQQKGSTHLNFLYHLFAKGADLCGDANGDVFCSAVLAAHAIKNTGSLLGAAAQVRLTQGNERSASVVDEATLILKAWIFFGIFEKHCRAQCDFSCWICTDNDQRSNRICALTQNLTRKKALRGPFSYSSFRPPFFSENLS